MKKILAILTLLAAALLPAMSKAQPAPSPGDWRLHNTYSYFFKRVVDTSDKVYFLALGLPAYTWSGSYNIEYPALFTYDKKLDEIEGYNAKNYLHGNIIKDMWYNAAKKYFLIVYDDYNIDILYTDDRCYNVPGLASAIVPGGKDVNFVTFDPASNRAYVGTSFGYLVIDDSKNVITESHIYGQNIKSIARVGNNLVAATADGLYSSPVNSSDRHSTWNSFHKIEGGPSSANNLLPLDGETFLYINDSNRLFKGIIDSEGNCTFDGKDIAGTNIIDINEIDKGYFMRTGWEGIFVYRNGVVENIEGTDQFRNAVWGTSTKDVVWRPLDHTGLEKLIRKDGNWVNSPSSTYGQYILPNSPNVFDAGSFVFSNTHGMIATSATYAHFHGSTEVGAMILVSAYKDNLWEPMHPYRLSGSKNQALRNTHPGNLDPYDDSLIWAGSATGGIANYNISNKATHSYIPVGGGNNNCATPQFDKNGTMWTVRQNPGNLCYWTKAARDAGTTSEFKSLSVPGFTAGAFPIFQPCTAEGRSNLIVLATGSYGNGIWIYDHKGTLDNSSDDRCVHISSPVDQDGQTINVTYVFAMMEDPATGRVWVGGDGGVYWFDPKTAFNDDFHVNRVKVPRNDGTNLADYLLEGSSVFCMGIDGAGHKWFGTLGNGIVETSATGAEIYRQMTTENSYLPSNDVIAVGFEPDSNCVWIGTKKGIAQYYSETAPGAENLDSVLAYPNPVRPDYYGHVTIKGLMDGSLVKILDASGGLVRELGRSEGGMMLWNLTNMGGRRVPTGVYYVATSTSGDTSESNVAKILVLN